MVSTMLSQHIPPASVGVSVKNQPVGVDKIVIAEKNVVAKDIAMGSGETFPPPIMYSFEDLFLSLKPK